jgi:DNA topoisomerase-1
MSVKDIRNELLSQTDGNEHSILTDVYGVVIGRMAGDPESVDTFKDPRLRQSGAGLVNHHSHPFDTPLSMGDMLHLAMEPGLETIYAHSKEHAYRARDISGDKDKLYREVKDAYGKAHSKELDKFITEKPPVTDEAREVRRRRFYNDIASTALADLSAKGLIDYEVISDSNVKSFKGGTGSGNFNHAGCIGEVGGSCKPAGAVGKTQSTIKVPGGETMHAMKRKDDAWLIGRKPAPAHLQKCKAPPTAKDPYGNLDPNGNRIAQWKDEKGRGQVQYGDNHNMAAAAAKFGRVSELRKKREQIFKEVEKDLADPKLKEEAAVTRLIMRTGMRPGSDKDTGADYKSYGATTLEGRHIKRTKDGLALVVFVPGKKKGQTITMPIHDKALAKDLLARAAKAGPNGRIFDTNADKVRDYSKTKDGGGFKTKDHRTALGTETAIAAIKKMKPPKTKKEYKAAVKEVSTRVSEVLGNTPSIAFKSYIDPTVFANWQVAND